MSPANRPGGRSRRTVSGGGNAYRRGSGLGSGSVGGGPRGTSGGSFGDSGGDRGVGGGGLLAVLLALLIGGSGNNNGERNEQARVPRPHLRARPDRGRRGVAAQHVLRQHGTSGFSKQPAGRLRRRTDSTSDGLSSADTADERPARTTSGSVSDALGSLLGNYGSTTGQIEPVSSTDEVYKAHEPDRDVASGAREKFTNVSGADSVTVMVYMCGTRSGEQERHGDRGSGGDAQRDARAATCAT